MRYALLAVLLMPLVCFAGEKEDSAELNKLLKDIRIVLPSTWRADIRIERRRDMQLELFVETVTAVEVNYVVFNLPPNSEKERPARDVFGIFFIARPFMTPQQYAQAKAKNVANEARRLAFVKENLAGVMALYMGPEPAPPDAYRPKNDRQRELVQQYASLWINTEPQVLPTHYRGTTALELWDDWGGSLADQSLQKEYLAIRKAIDGLLTPYERPKKD